VAVQEMWLLWGDRAIIIIRPDIFWKGATFLLRKMLIAEYKNCLGTF